MRELLIGRREAVKFLVVGGACYLLTVAVNYGLKLTVLAAKPVTALTIATIIASIASYILNREWSFRTRGGRRRHHEAALFFLVSGLGVLVNDIPLLITRYVLGLHVPLVSRLVQETSDFLAGMILGTLLATGFRLWAFRRWVFPVQDARPAPAGRRRTVVRATVHGPVSGPVNGSPVAGGTPAGGRITPARSAPR